MSYVLVALAGAVGALSRYGIGRAVGVRSFPWVTLGINLAGSFALGWVIQRSVQRAWSADVSAGIAAGFLGAFTTYSTFSNEVVTLLRTDRAGAALTYLALSVIGGIATAAAGYKLA